MDINKKIQAASHSGAMLKVVKQDDSFIVEKLITTGVDRNYIAAKKQKDFVEVTTGTYSISSIPISSVDKEEDKLIVKMPYIEGIGGEQIANYGSRNIASNLKVALNSYLINLMAKSKNEKIEKEVVVKKLNDIERATEDRYEIKTTVSKAISYVRELTTANLEIPVCQCHGDLTLSNIIITRENKMYLFDFLDSYIESPLQDAAKLIQDMKYGWSFRKEKSSVRLKGQLFCEAAFPDFINYLSKEYDSEMKIISMLTILRIAPYIKQNDKTTIDWFENTVNCILQDNLA